MKKPAHVHTSSPEWIKYRAYLEEKKAKNVAYRAKRTAREQEALAKAKAATANRDIDPTREEWLVRAVKLMLPILAELGYAPTHPVKVAMGICDTGRKSPKKGKTLGRCYHSQASTGEFREIFIDPSMIETRKILGVLTHELGHACLKDGVGHRAPFKKFCEAVGFEFEKCEFASDGASFWNWCKQVAADLGPIPHKALNTDHAEGEKKKQPTRMLKCKCPDCGAIIRTTKKVISAIAEKQYGRTGEAAYLNCIDPDCIGKMDIEAILGELELDGEGEGE